MIIRDINIWGNVADEHFMTKPTKQVQLKEEMIDISGKKGDQPVFKLPNFRVSANHLS